MFPPDVVYILKQHEQRAKLQRPAFVITHIQKFLDNEGELCSLDTLQLRLFCKLIRELNPPEGHGKHFPKVQAAMLGVLSAMPVVAEARYCLRNHQANTYMLIIADRDVFFCWWYVNNYHQGWSIQNPVGFVRVCGLLTGI